MKVLHVVERIDESYGGPAKSIPALCKSLKAYGVNSKIISVNLQDDKNESINRANIPWIKCNPLFNNKLYISLSFIHKLWQEIRTADIVHLHSIWTPPSIITYTYSKLLKKSLVISPRSSLLSMSLLKSKRIKLVARYFFVDKLLNKASAIIATSALEKDQLPVYLHKKTAIIPNAINPDDFTSLLSKTDAKNKLHVSRDEIAIGFISRIHKRKGFDRFIDLCINAATNNNHKRLKFLAAGPIDDKKLFDTQIEKLKKHNIIENFTYLGFVDGNEKTEFYCACDLIVLPSSFENFGMSIAESLYFGTPVICSTGTPWTEINSINAGWCVELENFDKTLTFALNSDLSLLGCNARNYIIDNFSEERVGAAMSNTYYSISKGKPDDTN